VRPGRGLVVPRAGRSLLVAWPGGRLFIPRARRSLVIALLLLGRVAGNRTFIRGRRPALAASLPVTTAGTAATAATATPTAVVPVSIPFPPLLDGPFGLAAFLAGRSIGAKRPHGRHLDAGTLGRSGRPGAEPLVDRRGLGTLYTGEILRGPVGKGNRGGRGARDDDAQSAPVRWLGDWRTAASIPVPAVTALAAVGPVPPQGPVPSLGTIGTFRTIRTIETIPALGALPDPLRAARPGRKGGIPRGTATSGALAPTALAAATPPPAVHIPLAAAEVPVAARAATNRLSVLPGGREAKVGDDGGGIHGEDADDAQQEPDGGIAEGRKGMETARGEGAQADDGGGGSEGDRKGVGFLLLLLNPAHGQSGKDGRAKGGEREGDHRGGVPLDPPGEGGDGPAGHSQIDNPGDNKGRYQK
jgi:hypothetical protein